MIEPDLITIPKEWRLNKLPICHYTEAELVEAGADYARKFACQPTGMPARFHPSTGSGFVHLFLK